jgi:hypothetical protein
MLRRVRTLLAPAGRLLCELHPEHDGSPGPVRLEGLGVASAWFDWALLGRAGLAAAAGAAALRLEDSWEHSGRMFAALTPV